MTNRKKERKKERRKNNEKKERLKKSKSDCAREIQTEDRKK